MWRIYSYNNNNTLQFAIRATATVSVTTESLSTNQWYHLVGIYDSAAKVIKLYKDGVLVGTADTSALSWTDVSSGNLMMGWDQWSCNNVWFNGNIDEVRIYNRALSVEEIRYHYNKGGPVAQWKFNEGEGRTIYDSAEASSTASMDGALILAGSATSSAWVSGKYGSALSFDGVDDYVDGGNVSSNARTVSFWLKRGDTSNKDVIDLGTPEIKITSNAITSTGLTSPTYYIDGINGNTSVPANEWHYITITDTADIAASNVDIGKASSNYFLGLIDDVRIYNYVRTQEQIRQDYNQGLGAHFK